MSTIIKNGVVVTASDIFKADIQIDNEIIINISNEITPKNTDHVIDASNQYVLPGGIDPHTHLANPGTVDDFISGTKAAAAGGITTIINYIEPNKNQSFLEDFREWKKKAEGSYIDYGFHSIINECNHHVLNELSDLLEEGVTSIKIFTAYRNDKMLNDIEIYKLMKRAKKIGMLTNVHAENGDIIDLLINDALKDGKIEAINHANTRPVITEAEATNRVLSIAEVLDAVVYIVHVTTKDSLNEIIDARNRGVFAFAETCPHYLTLDKSYLKKVASESVKYICSPPLRSKEEQLPLWRGIKNNEISTIGSDHSSIPYKGGKQIGEKNFSKVPNGLPGVEDSFSLLYHYGVHKKRISIQRFVEVISTNPAKIFGLYPKKGTIMPGSDADIVLLDPNRTRSISHNNQYQNVDYNIYEGIEIQGVITHVLSRGKEIVCENSILETTGKGKYLKRKSLVNNHYYK